jgi:hypothetical protein
MEHNYISVHLEEKICTNYLFRSLPSWVVILGCAHRGSEVLSSRANWVHPHPQRNGTPPPFGYKGTSYTRLRGMGTNSDEGTDTMVLYEYSAIIYRSACVGTSLGFIHIQIFLHRGSFCPLIRTMYLLTIKTPKQYFTLQERVAETL